MLKTLFDVLADDPGLMELRQPAGNFMVYSRQGYRLSHTLTVA